MQNENAKTPQAPGDRQSAATVVIPPDAPAASATVSPSAPAAHARRTSRKTATIENTGEPATRRRARKVASPAVADVALPTGNVASDALADTLSAPLQPHFGATPSTPHTPRRRTNGPLRGRESGVLGLAERARFAAERQAISPLLDPLLTALPALRRTLLNSALDEALRQVADEIAQALAPATLQIWTADPAPWMGGARPGGQQLIPALRLRASATAIHTRLNGDQANELAGDLLVAAPTGPLTTPAFAATGHGASAFRATPDPLIDEVITTRRPVMLHDADDHPLASAWTLRLPAPIAPFSASPTLGSLVAYPLRARGQFLGALAVATRGRLLPRHLAALEEVADLAALAADRDSLLSYSRSQDALAQTMVHHAPVAMAALTGPDHVFAFANPAFGQLLGLEDVAAVIGRRLEDVASERARSLIASLRIEAVHAGGETQAMIELPVHLDRGLTYWNVTTSPVAGLTNDVSGVLVAAVDVTPQAQARLRAQESAEVAQERIGQMLTLHATTLATASQLGADPRELLADILHRSVALLNGRAGTIYARDPRRNELEVMVCQGLHNDYTGERIRVGEGFAGQVAAIGKGVIIDDYRAYPYHAAIYDNEDFSAVIAVPLVHHNQVVGVLDVLDDAERRTFTDDDLWLLDLFAAQAAQAMENARLYVVLERAYHKQRELDRMKDDFIATASHELRTPLTGVQGFLELLLDYTAEQGDPLVVEFTQKAADSAQELAEIAERLLQTSRLDTGRMELHTTPVRLAQAVEDSLRSFRELQAAQGATHDLISEVPSDVYVQADLGRLKEALDNLVSNAIKYSPQGGRVRVQCARVRFKTPARSDEPMATAERIEERPTLVLPHLTRDASEATALIDPDNDPSAPATAVIAAASAQPYYVALVSDEGMGIAPEERSRLFGRFARLDAARISQIRGTGLGLYICRQMMRAMGGDVWLHQSAPNSGSVFALALPGANPAHSEEIAQEW